MLEPKYHLEGIVHTRSEEMEDFEGPLDVIFLLLSKNKNLPIFTGRFFHLNLLNDCRCGVVQDQGNEQACQDAQEAQNDPAAAALLGFTDHVQITQG